MIWALVVRKLGSLRYSMRYRELVENPERG
jgi:hypothetical protein